MSDIMSGANAALSDSNPTQSPTNSSSSPAFNLGNAGGTVGSLASAGAAIGSIIPGVGTVVGGAIGAGVGVIADLVSYFSNQSDMASANQEAKKMDAEQLQREDEKNAFSENMANKEFDAQTQQNAFNQKQTNLGNAFNISQSMIQKMTNMVNTNDGLKNALVARAGGR